MAGTSASWEDLMLEERFAGGVRGLAGGVPLCEWELIPTDITPLYVDLFRDVLNPKWPLENNECATITQSISFDDKKAPEYDQIKNLNDRVSAVIVRPGPAFDPQYLYKVTLYQDWKYTNFLLPLTLGVYPDIHRYDFGDKASSVRFERGRPKDFTDPHEAARSYYQ